MRKARHLTTVLLAALLAAGCQTGRAPQALSIRPLGLTTGAATLVVRVQPPARRKYQLSYLVAADWDRAEGVLARGGQPVATVSVAPEIDAATGRRTARLVFSGIQPGSGYELDVRLLRAEQSGAEAVVSSAELDGLSVGTGSQEVEPVLVRQDRVAEAVPEPKGVGGAWVASWPARGPSGRFERTMGICELPDGSWALAGQGDNMILRVRSDGYVSRLAGDGVADGDDGPGATASFNEPDGLEVGPDGALYVADRGNNRIRRIDLVDPAHPVTTWAGSGASGMADGPRLTATFASPRGTKFAPDGTCWVADGGNSAIRRIDPDGTVTKIAAGFGLDNGPANVATFYHPTSLDLGPDGSLYIVDSANHVIRRMAPDLTFETWAGTGQAGTDDGAWNVAKFNAPNQLFRKEDGTLIVVDTLNHRLRAIAPDRTVSTIAGSEEGYADGEAAAAKFFRPFGIAPAPDGGVMISDFYNYRVRKLGPDGLVTTVAGSGVAGFMEGPFGNEPWYHTGGLVVAADGTIFVSDDWAGGIYKIAPDGTITTHAGDVQYGFADDVGAAARFDCPTGMALGADGDLYVADFYNNRIRHVASDGTTTTYAGDGGDGRANGDRLSARFSLPSGVARASDGTLYVADSGNHQIRRITPAGQVELVAGAADGSSGFADLPGADARFSTPYNLALTPDGDLLVADAANNRIRRIDLDDESHPVTTVAGDGSQGATDGPSGEASFYYPMGLHVEADGTILVVDCGNHRVRRIGQGQVTTIAGSDVAGYRDGSAADAAFSYPTWIGKGPDGAYYVASNSWVRKLTF